MSIENESEQAHKERPCAACGEDAAGDFCVGLYNPFDKQADQSHGFWNNSFCLPCYLTSVYRMSGTKLEGLEADVVRLNNDLIEASEREQDERRYAFAQLLRSERLEAELHVTRQALRKAHQAMDIMKDGPDDSDVAHATALWAESKKVLDEGPKLCNCHNHRFGGVFAPHLHTADGVVKVLDDKTRGLYGKYFVERVDGNSGPGSKHATCFYFVLDLHHDKHALPAIKDYIASCEREYPELAADLARKVEEVTGKSFSRDRNPYVQACEELSAKLEEAEAKIEKATAAFKAARRHAVAPGLPCGMCGARWVDDILIHLEGCANEHISLGLKALGDGK